MKAVYTDNPGFYTSLIKLIESGDWSHVAIIDGDHVVEAGISYGVRRRRLDSLQADVPDHIIIDVPTPNDEAGLLWLRGQVGKAYDTWGVIGLPFTRQWEEESKWWCSELWMMTLVKAGITIPGKYRSIGVTPSLRIAASVPGARIGVTV